jgi:cytochrome c
MHTLSIPLMPIMLIFSMLLIAACSQEASDSTSALDSTIGAIAQQSSKGAEITRKKCGSCHSLDRNIRKVGPPLKGIIGKKPTISDIPFEAWTAENMDKWIENPRSIKKRTRMALPGISDPAERKAIIDYLKLI